MQLRADLTQRATDAADGSTMPILARPHYVRDNDQHEMVGHADGAYNFEAGPSL